jgi:uncharacterized protein YkwD
MSPRRITLAVVAALMAATTWWLAPAQAAAPTTYQRDAIAATNAQRADHHRVVLKKKRCVQRFATSQARRMAHRETMFHQSLGPIQRRCGLSMVGENVAYGYPDGTSVVDDGWMGSPPHRANILERQYRLIGVGARQSRGGTWYVSQVFGRKASR